jgi:hypothetical protein
MSLARNASRESTLSRIRESAVLGHPLGLVHSTVLAGERGYPAGGGPAGAAGNRVRHLEAEPAGSGGLASGRHAVTASAPERTPGRKSQYGRRYLTTKRPRRVRIQPGRLPTSTLHHLAAESLDPAPYLKSLRSSTSLLKRLIKRRITSSLHSAASAPPNRSGRRDVELETMRQLGDRQLLPGGHVAAGRRRR